ncbi:MAG: NAD(P)H-dependent oxidoreductase subunit E, partial [Clostridia bacterium]|nr:NAD(P)H-dependent oxidoreductase subunit E [Clostridia bacterium]
MQIYRSHVLVCSGTGCTASGSAALFDEFEAQLKAQGLENEVKVVKTGCFGLCAQGPIVVVYPEGSMYCKVKKEDVAEIVSEHLLKGRIVKRLLESNNEEQNTQADAEKTDFFKKQLRIALRNCGKINPENIDEYIAQDGYEALGRVITTMTPEQVIDIMLKSGLRGRGGAGFPTGRKWDFARKSVSDKKYVCCNADEGDP